MTTPIHDAVRHGDVSVIHSSPMLALRQANRRSSLLRLALTHHQPQVVQELVARTAAAKYGESVCDSWKPVHLPAFLGDLPALKAMDEATQKTKSLGTGETFVHIAAVGDQPEVLEFLVREVGLDVSERTESDRTALHLAAQYGCLRAIPALVQLGEDPNVGSKTKRTPIHTAARHGQLEAVEKLIELGGSIKRHDQDQQTALHLVAALDDPVLVERLVEMGSKLDVHDRWGRTPFAIASANGHLAVMDQLVAMGADVHKFSKDRETPLHWAAKRGHTAAIAKLVQLGIAPDTPDKNGNTALHAAASSPRCDDAVRRLLQLGANRDLRNRQKETALDVCSSEQSRKTLREWFPITPSIAQLLLSVRAGEDNALSRLATHPLFDRNILEIIKCFITGEHNGGFETLMLSRNHLRHSSSFV